ncbi:MAG: cupin, partial [bacterium]
ILFVKKGQRLSLQYHNVKHETLYLDAGKIRMTIGPHQNRLEERIMEPGTIIEIVPGTRHRIEALEDSKIFEVSSPELDDVVRISDDFGREGTSIP